jgi:hypothetical protein
MAAQGLRDLGDGHEKIANAEIAESIRARGSFINRAVFVCTVIATGLIVLARVA